MSRGMLSKLPARKYVICAGIIVLISMIAFIAAASTETETAASVIETPRMQPLEGNITISKNEIWPSKTLVSQTTEYQPTSDPSIAAAYCVNYFADDSYTYEYIGLSKAPDYNVTCG